MIQKVGNIFPPIPQGGKLNGNDAQPVKQILAEYKGIDKAIIQPETTMESLGIDSLDTVELVMNLEDEFHVEIEVDEAINTVGDLVKIIEGLL